MPTRLRSPQGVGSSAQAVNIISIMIIQIILTKPKKKNIKANFSILSQTCKHQIVLFLQIRTLSFDELPHVPLPLLLQIHFQHYLC